MTRASQRSSFALGAGSVQAVLPAAVGTQPIAWLEANYVTLFLTGQFLFTVHAAPSPALQQARHQYCGLDEDARADEVRLLFLVTDVLIGSFRPQLLAIDDRLGEIQLGMLRGVSPKVHDELIKVLGILTDAIQELGWYAHDLEDIAEMVDELPGMRPVAQQHFDRHRRRVTRMQENAKNMREQAKDALSHYSEVVAGRQAQVINTLTIVATVFLPLSFLTGYFGMNFRILTSYVQNTLWQTHTLPDCLRAPRPLPRPTHDKLPPHTDPHLSVSSEIAVDPPLPSRTSLSRVIRATITRRGRYARARRVIRWSGTMVGRGRALGDFGGVITRRLRAALGQTAGPDAGL